VVNLLLARLPASNTWLLLVVVAAHLILTVLVEPVVLVDYLLT
jgi:hypothetical protein